MMRVAMIASAASAAAVWATWPATQHPLVPKLVAIEGVTEARQDTTSFRARWRDMPPATVIRYSVSALTEPTEKLVARPTRRVERPVRTRRVSLQGDICQRHGMHKVHYGRRWRCRR
jgi:hypothetical protein